MTTHASAVSADDRLASRLSLFGVSCRVAPPAASVESAALTSPTAARRSIVAQQAFTAGAIVLQSTPHAFVVTPLPSALPADSSSDGGSARARCEWCGLSASDAAGGRLHRCSQCRTSCYCSAACQKRAWSLFHSFECRHVWSRSDRCALLGRLATEARLDLMLLGRCVRTRAKQIGLTAAEREQTAAQRRTLEAEGAPLHSDLEDLIGLESHYDFLTRAVESHGQQSAEAAAGKASSEATALATLSDEAVLGMAQRLTDNTQLVAIGLELGLFGPRITAADADTVLLPIITAFQSNNFALTNGLLVASGAGVYPLGALLNHSCEPNCVIIYESRRKGEPCDQRGPAGSDDAGTASASLYPDSFDHIQTIRTLRPVAAGEELTHAYIDIASVTRARRRHLAERYYFHCQCARCTRDERPDAGPDAFESFLERDIDLNQLPEDILECDAEEGKEGTETDSKTSKTPTQASPSDSASTLPTDRRAALLRANRFWLDATRIHLADHADGATAEAIALEEAARARREQTLLAAALQLRLTHLHPYCVQVMSTQAKLMHAALINSDLHAAASACDQLCRKYRVIYGDAHTRRAEIEAVRRRREQDTTDAANRPFASVAAAAANPHAEEEDDDDPDDVSEYPSLPTHPLLGLQLYTLGSIHSELGSTQLARDTFRAALRILEVTHGERHPLVRALRKEAGSGTEEART